MFNGYKIGSITFPNSFISIGDYTFYGATFANEFSLPSNIETIGNRAFISTGVVVNYFPESLKTICQYAFANTSPKNVVLGSNVTSIG